MGMNGREREALTMRHSEPDRVPVQCQLSVGHIMLNSGYKPHEIWYETEALADAMVALALRYRFDGLLLLLPGRPRNYLDQQAASLKMEEGGYWIHWKNGDKTWFVADDFPIHHAADPLRPMRADFDHFDPDKDMGEIDGYLGYVWNVLYHMQEVPEKADRGILRAGHIPDYMLDMFDAVKKRTGDSLSLHGSIYSPLTHYFELFGYEKALIGFLTDPGKAHAVLEILTENVLAWAHALVRKGVDAIDHSSAFVAAPFLSRKMYQEFVVPYEKRVNQAIREAGCTVYTHTCGSIGDRLDLLVATGTQGCDTLDPPPLGDGDLERAKRDFGRQLFFKGNMNAVGLLDFTTEAEVVQEVKEKLRIGMPGAGYILDVACAVAPHVEPWKLELLTPLAEEFGRYEPVPARADP